MDVFIRVVDHRYLNRERSASSPAKIYQPARIIAFKGQPFAEANYVVEKICIRDTLVADECAPYDHPQFIVVMILCSSLGASRG